MFSDMIEALTGEKFAQPPEKANLDSLKKTEPNDLRVKLVKNWQQFVIENKVMNQSMESYNLLFSRTR